MHECYFTTVKPGGTLQKNFRWQTMMQKWCEQILHPIYTPLINYNNNEKMNIKMKLNIN